MAFVGMAWHGISIAMVDAVDAWSVLRREGVHVDVRRDG